MQTSYIDIANCARAKVFRPLSVYVRVIINQRNIDAIGSCRVFKGSHIPSGSIVGDLVIGVFSLLTILVLNLIDKSVSAIGYKVLASKL